MPATSPVETQLIQASDSARTFAVGSWAQHLRVLVPILMVYGALAFFRIDHQSFWLDEVLSLRGVNPDQPFLVSERWFGGRGPLYPALLQLWMTWGTGEFALRSLSALLGGVTVCLTYLVGLRLCGRQVAQTGAILLATSPFLIWYSQEVRYIMLMVSTALLSTYVFHLALSAKRPGWWLLYCCSLILAIAAFVVNVFLPVVHGLYLASSPSHRAALRKWSVCLCVVFILSVWWANDGHVRQLGGHLHNLSVQLTTGRDKLSSTQPIGQVAGGAPRKFTAMAVPYTFFAFSAGFSLGPSLQELHVSRPLATLGAHALTISIAALVFGSLFLLGLVALWHHPETAKFLSLWLAVPMIGALAVSAILAKMPFNVRYVAMAFPAYVLVLSAGLAGLRKPILRLTLLAAVLLVNGLALANYYTDPQYSREDARSAARYLEATAQPGDIIVLVGARRVLEHYYRGSVPIIAWHDMVVAHQAASIDRLQTLHADHAYLWLVAIRAWQVDAQGTVKATLDDRYTLITHKELPGVNIYSYRLN